MFILLPFSYFFTESEGFSGQRRGLMPRVYETIAVLMLLALLVFGLAVLALAFFDNDNSAQVSGSTPLRLVVQLRSGL